MLKWIIDILEKLTINARNKARLDKMDRFYNKLDGLSDKEIKLEIIATSNKYTHMKLQLSIFGVLLISLIFSKIIETTIAMVISILSDNSELSMLLTMSVITLATAVLLIISMCGYIFIQEMKYTYEKLEMLKLIDKTRS